MPTYEYKCFSCKQEFSIEQSITAEPVKQCTLCGRHRVKRLISKTSFELKGKGWFKDGY